MAMLKIDREKSKREATDCNFDFMFDVIRH